MLIISQNHSRAVYIPRRLRRIRKTLTKGYPAACCGVVYFYRMVVTQQTRLLSIDWLTLTRFNRLVSMLLIYLEDNNGRH